MGDADLDWDAVSKACDTILTSRTAREWDIGAEKENIAAEGGKCEFLSNNFNFYLVYSSQFYPSGMRLVDLFPNAPTKVSEDGDSDDGEGGGADVEEDLFDALDQKSSSAGWAARQDGGTSKSKTTHSRNVTRWLARARSV